MKNDYFMKQCELKRENTHTISWLPEEFAHVGQCVQLKNKDNWDRGYSVTAVSNVRKLASLLIVNEEEYKKHRNKSDI